MEYLDFVIENYVWFLVGGIVLLMTLIGYFAEKTQFGKKKSKKQEKIVEKAPVKSVKIPSVQEQPEELLFEQDMPVQDAEVEMVEEEPMEDLDAIEIQEPEEKEEIEEEIPEELYAGLDGTPNTYKIGKEAEDLDMDLPNIEDLKTDIDDTNSDDDIWRF